MSEMTLEKWNNTILFHLIHREQNKHAQSPRGVIYHTNELSNLAGEKPPIKIAPCPNRSKKPDSQNDLLGLFIQLDEQRQYIKLIVSGKPEYHEVIGYKVIGMEDGTEFTAINWSIPKEEDEDLIREIEEIVGDIEFVTAN